METTHRPLSSSFLWLIFQTLQGNPKKELLRGLWVQPYYLYASASFCPKEEEALVAQT